MKHLNIKLLYTSLILLLAIAYVFMMLYMIGSHYTEISSTPHGDFYEAMQQKNWKYWFEGTSYLTTPFSDFLQFIDEDYIHSNGMIAIVVNIVCMIASVFLLTKIVYELFGKDKTFVRRILPFVIIVFLFSSLQDGSIVWNVNRQLFTAYFFPLLSYYLLVRYSVSKSKILYISVLVSTILIIFTTPYYFAALTVLFFLGLSMDLDRTKKLLLAIPLLVSLSSYPHQTGESISAAIGLFSSFSETMRTLHYVCIYLGSPFVYISFEPCLATSAILSGCFMVMTFVYFLYLWISKQISERIYSSILAFLAFYILTAFSSLSMEKTGTVIFRNAFMTPSLIAWLLVIILYLHFFLSKPTIYRRIVVAVLTFVTVLYGYQIRTYDEYRQGNPELKSAIAALQLGIDDPYFMKRATRLVYLMRYIPVKPADKKMSIFTVNDLKNHFLNNRKNLLNDVRLFEITDQIRKLPVTTIFSGGMHLRGSLDEIVKDKGRNDIIKVRGWIYNARKNNVPKWLVVLDPQRNVIGYILSGTKRKDVENIYGTNALRSGFVGYIKSKTKPNKLWLVDEVDQEVIHMEYSP